MIYKSWQKNQDEKDRRGTEKKKKKGEGVREEWKGEVALNGQQRLALSKCKHRESIKFAVCPAA